MSSWPTCEGGLWVRRGESGVEAGMGLLIGIKIEKGLETGIYDG